MRGIVQADIPARCCWLTLLFICPCTAATYPLELSKTIRLLMACEAWEFCLFVPQGGGSPWYLMNRHRFWQLPYLREYVCYLSGMLCCSVNSGSKLCLPSALWCETCIHAMYHVLCWHHMYSFCSVCSSYVLLCYAMLLTACWLTKFMSIWLFLFLLSII